jgi:hypothetical protein
MSIQHAEAVYFSKACLFFSPGWRVGFTILNWCKTEGKKKQTKKWPYSIKSSNLRAACTRRLSYWPNSVMHILKWETVTFALQGVMGERGVERIFQSWFATIFKVTALADYADSWTFCFRSFSIDLGFSFL